MAMRVVASGQSHWQGQKKGHHQHGLASPQLWQSTILVRMWSKGKHLVPKITIVAQWKAMDVETCTQYEDLAAWDRKQYQQELEDWRHLQSPFSHQSVESNCIIDKELSAFGIKSLFQNKDVTTENDIWDVQQNLPLTSLGCNRAPSLHVSNQCIVPKPQVPGMRSYDNCVPSYQSCYPPFEGWMPVSLYTTIHNTDYIQIMGKLLLMTTQPKPVRETVLWMLQKNLDMRHLNFYSTYLEKILCITELFQWMFL